MQLQMMQELRDTNDKNVDANNSNTNLWMKLPSNGRTKSENFRKVVKRRRTRRSILSSERNNNFKISLGGDFQTKPTQMTFSNATIIDHENILVIPRAIHELEYVNYHNFSIIINRTRSEFTNIDDANNQSQQQGCFAILQYLMLWMLAILYHDITFDLSARNRKYI